MTNTISNRYCIDVVMALIKYGDMTLGEFMSMYQCKESKLPNELCNDNEESIEEMMMALTGSERCLMICLLTLDEDILHYLLILSVYPGSFSEESAIYIIGKQIPSFTVKSILRKLYNRCMIYYYDGYNRYQMNKTIKHLCDKLIGHLSKI